MTDNLKIDKDYILNNESLIRILRLNISFHFGKEITPTLLDEITKQIIDSIEFSLDKEA